MEEQFKDLFIEESRQILDDLREGLARLSAEGLPADGLKDLRRFAHSLKGMAATMGLPEIGAVARRLEELFEKASNRDLVVGRDDCEVIRRAVGAIGTLVDGFRRGDAPSTEYKEVESQLSGIIARGRP